MKRKKNLTAEQLAERKLHPNPHIKSHVFAYIQIARVEVEDFIAICEKLSEHGEKISNRKKQWISMIDAGKLTCNITNTPVAYLSYDITNHKKEDMRSYHFNFYNDKDELLTVDHVYPKSLGGSLMEVNNLQPMVGEHNWKKSSQLDYNPKI